jgi:SpoIID/LytB domain protein
MAALAFGMLLPIPAHAAGIEVSGEAPGAAPTAPPPVEVKKTKVPAVPPETDGRSGSGQVVAELPQTSTSSFRMIGVTWSAESLSYGVTVQVRTRTAGSWSAWTTLDVDQETEGGTPGTEPLWVGKADGVAARVTSTLGAPQDIRISTIDPGSGTTANATNAMYLGSVDGVATAETVADGTPTYTPMPTIITRAGWGAAAGTPCDSPTVGSTTKGVIVHHTAGSNSYAIEDSKALVRGVQAYHMQSRGWCDIGYNFLVDKYGQIFEGRRGGMDRSVRGAHSGNLAVNTYDMGVSMMGNLDLALPTAAMQASMVKLIGWRMGTNYLRAKGTYTLGGLTLNMIAGHRNVVSTGCPGKYGYSWLSATGGLRDRVAAYIGSYSSSIKTRAASLGLTKTGAVFVGEAITTGGRKTRFGNMDIYSKSGVGTKFVSSAADFRARYGAYGSQKSKLGFPTSDSPSVSTTGTFAQRFEHGSIYAVRTSTSTKAYAIWGTISTLYKQLGEAGGKLGRPTSSVTTVSTYVTRANFASGYITSNSSTGRTVAYTSSGTVIATLTTADNLIVPSSRYVPLTGHGYGHGIGMGQYGAQGAAAQGLTSGEILRHYYPGTTVATKAATPRVLITGDTSSSVAVKPRTGLVYRNVATGTTRSLPTVGGGLAITRWQIVPRSGAQTSSVLQYLTSAGWTTYGSSWTGDAQFEAPGPIALVLPGGTTATYRGALRSALPAVGSTARDTVNVVPLESYLRGVVPAEMPASWQGAALRAQSVAARTYLARLLTPSRYYDICDTTSCQVYRGTSIETASTDAAITATAGRILTYNGIPALTQFSSSSGGYTASGGQPYLPVVSDTYDASSGNPYHTWTTSVPASRIERAYPSIGTLKSLAITKRSGAGSWGGRVVTISLVGSSATITISGNQARAAFAIKSNWFRF